MKKTEPPIPITAKNQNQAPGSSIPSMEQTAREDVKRDPLVELLRMCKREGIGPLDLLCVLLFKEVRAVDKIHDQIQAAFQGQIFFPNRQPDAPENTRRFNACMSYHKQVTDLLAQLIRVNLAYEAIATRKKKD